VAGTSASSDFVAPALRARGLATAAASLILVGGIAAYDPAAAGVVALLGAGLLLARIHPGLVAPYLALAMPLGYWHPHLAGVQVPALEAAAAGAALGCLPRVVSLSTVRVRPAAADLAFAVLFAGICSSGAGPVPKGAWAHQVVFWGSLAVVFFAIRPALRTRRFRSLYLYSIGIAGGAEAIVAFVQYFEGSSGRFSRLGGAIVFPQPEGTLENPNAAAWFLVVCLLLLAGLALAERGGRRGVVTTAAVVIGVGSLLPYSRGGWISLAAGLLAWSGAQRRARRLIGTIVILGALLGGALAFGGTFGARLSSLASRHFSDLYGFRLTLAGRAAHIILHHPFTGAGVFHEVGTYAGRPSLATHPHDLLLGVAVFFGIPAALAFLGLLVTAVRGALGATLEGSARLRAEGAGALAALVALIVDGFLEYPFWNTSLTVLTVTVLAYAVTLGECVPKRQSPTLGSPTMPAAMPPKALS
jgi:O-antigen ligase